MNAGVVFALLLIAYSIFSVFVFFKVVFSPYSPKDRFFYKIPPIITYCGLFALIAGFIVLICALSYRPYNPNAGSNKYKVECSMCGRSFDNTSSDAKSIRSTNMCTQCYKNYSSAQDALGN